jgi:methionyl-tRNA synthetase
MKKNKFYVTTPLYYVNAVPHLGTLYSTVLADIATRWNKLLGKKVFFTTGTDEHGQKLQEKAESVGKAPKEFVDSMVPQFKKMWEKFEIDYTKFIRTTDKEHTQVVSQWIQKLLTQGDIYKSYYTGLYCVPCEAFITNSSEATEKDTNKPMCPLHKRELTEVQEESYFFRLSSYQDQLLDFYEKNPEFITPKERINEVISFVKSGLKDLSISRKTIKWGIPFPGDSNHTVYVWGDALNGYISALGQEREFWWPADLQIMAKDILRFHAVYWPAFLIAAGLPLPKKLLVHGFILMGEQKMSKSLGNVLDPYYLADTYGVEQLRYYLARQMAITQDCQFDIKDLQEHITADLANNLGNLLSRTVTLAINNNITELKGPETLEPQTAHLKEKCEEAFRIYYDEMSKYTYHTALSELWKFIALVNSYFHMQQPWVLAKQNRELFIETLYASCQSLYSIAILLWPIMPQKMESLLNTLGHTLDTSNNYEEELRKNLWDKTFVLKPITEPLFIRPNISLEPETPAQKTQTQEQTQVQKESSDIITFDTFAKVTMSVGTIISCEKVEGSDKLLKLQIDCGPLGTRQVISGVAEYFKPEDLINKQGICVINLAPRKIKGLESQGMMLFAHDSSGNMQLLTLTGPVENGTRVT